ncbi:MAG: MgtC/SapB family protein [Verrucomicrobiaceae bacterium]|nr:MgtC/SapB family protein [Verrucomicrobiaceae bacterium]
MNESWMLYSDIALRLTLAVAGGSIIGINRYLHHKAAGMRTHALTALGAALATVLIIDAAGSDAQAFSRVLQGLVTGIGFLGAGVILHNADDRVQGLTTAASIWLSSIFGIAMGRGAYAAAFIAIALALFILVVGKFVEHAIVDRLQAKHKKNIKSDSPPRL